MKNYLSYPSWSVQSVRMQGWKIGPSGRQVLLPPRFHGAEFQFTVGAHTEQSSHHGARLACSSPVVLHGVRELGRPEKHLEQGSVLSQYFCAPDMNANPGGQQPRAQPHPSVPVRACLRQACVGCAKMPAHVRCLVLVPPDSL